MRLLLLTVLLARLATAHSATFAFAFEPGLALAALLLTTLTAAHSATFAFAFEPGLALAALLLATLTAAHATATFTLEVGLATLLPGAAFVFLLLLTLEALVALAALLLLALETLLALAALLLLLTVVAALLLLLTVAPAALVLLPLPVAVLILAFLHVKSPLKVPDLTRSMNALPECRVPPAEAAGPVPVPKRCHPAPKRFRKVGNNRGCG